MDLDKSLPETTKVPTRNFEEIELSQEEEQEGLRKAREEKFYRQVREEYNNRIKAADTWRVPNARELYERLLQTRSNTGERFQVTEWNKQIIFDLCLYFANDTRFNDRGDGYSLKKGICISGKPGTGKSHLMAFFSKNPNCSYSHITCTAVAERYRTEWSREGMDTLQWYAQPLKAEYGHQYGQTVLGYCFGDLGTESDKKSYGNGINVMEHIIFQRYENKLDFNLTHITTNLNPTEIEERYGIRVRDRLKESMNFLILKGESFR